MDNNIPEKFTKPYDPTSTEPRIYSLWEESGFFNPEKMIAAGHTAPDAKPFTIMMPPPNATGILHMGHAMMLTLEDIMVRYKRMRGFRTLWLPGTDHAAIATQSKVEKEIYKKEGKSRHDLGREELLKRIDAFVQESRNTITTQTKVMGASCDWSREAFTLDAARNRAVNTMFKKMYDDGIIYRGHRIVNWDPKGQTTIADDEIVYEERTAKMYTFKYSKDFPIAISTTRPETKVGDVAVAVHPEDPRYKSFIGKTHIVEDFCGVRLEIQVIADEAVEMEFGTGALGVTPAHSMTDWEIADRHNLARPQVINEYAKMSVGDERILGKKTTEVREIIVEWLRTEGLLEKEEDIKQNISTAERTGGIVEPLPKLQWFVNVNKTFILPNSTISGIPSGTETTLKEIMKKSVENGQIKILPDHFQKTYFSWINNLRDWCISRQIWYGHRVPVWYDKENNPHVLREQKFFLARHGQSESNTQRTKPTSIVARETPLTEQGKEEARDLGNSLKNKNITKIISSSLPRSIETARIVAKEIGFDVEDIEIWDDYREVQIGDINAGKERPKGWSPLQEAVEFGSGETLEQIESRTRSVFEKMKKAQSEGAILLVGHNSFNSCLRAHIEGKTSIEYLAYRNRVGSLPNGSVIELNILQEPQIENLIQDPDTLDTWFSSGMWTFSTLGWPDKTKDLEIYHPTDVLETGYEIIFFWVARMILMSGYALGDVPFHTVYFHGTVRDGKGQKMSKSLGNGLDPIDIANKYGADAARMALIVGTAPGTDSKIDENKIKGYKNFANKIWNITRFILSSADQDVWNKDIVLTEADKKLKQASDELIADITSDYEAYRFHLTGEKIYGYLWHELADKILEESKEVFKDGTPEAQASRSWLLGHLLKTWLVILHPLMPFVTEEIWGLLDEKQLLMVTPWPHDR